VAENDEKKPPKWARYQVALGILYLNLGIGLFLVQAVAEVMWGRAVDFGWLAPTLVSIGVYVVFGPVLVEIAAAILGRAKGP
jgi:hypothetical protein